jgi:hypothetical protein
MLLMSKPEPMPVEEMTVLAVDVAVEGVVDEIEEAMSLALIPISPYVGKPDQYLSKTRTISIPNRPAVAHHLRVAVHQTAGDPHAAREGREFGYQKLADDSAAGRIDLLDHLVAGARIHPKLIGSARIIEMFVELRHERREGRRIARLGGRVSGRLGRSLAAGRQCLAAAFLKGDGYLRLTSVH